ncbi:PEPxxWA-CTERM sorting domain-containing protein [Sphingomonas rubra]|uniref:PEP-CTERM protein-sorting domain-containing protein n=1 Tax=Sphingomonas rubra TaxID=634430 RepID=A0A1I5UEW9_9SPHN|nr:PEPxxWA-CTERM sorting domain-containing protein [Sphingomonas rubra]SFP93823.1 PEP-CTERM protein-sorting domain-containing protein [Sphingomonas rubra]
MAEPIGREGEWNIMRRIIFGMLAAMAAATMASPGQTATIVYTGEDQFTAAHPGVPKFTNLADAVLTVGPDDAYSTTIGAATITSPFKLRLHPCELQPGTCLMSNTLTDAGAAAACADAYILPGDPLYSACLQDILFEEKPTPTGITVAGSSVGLNVSAFHSHGDVTIAYTVNGEKGQISFNRFGFIGFSGDGPLDIALTSSASLFISTVHISPTPMTAAVPEPATWSLMLLGFAGIGTAMRRRRASAAVSLA